jgi:hypothetical protein
MTHTLGRFVLVLLFLPPLTATRADAQVKEPPRADKVDVQIRYRIRADRDERVRQYQALEKHLASLGFVDANKDDPDRDLDILDPNAERFNGTLPGAKVLDILNDVRVQNILFAPAGFAYPDAPDKPVAVRIGLRSGLTIAAQQELHKQVVQHLGRLGFAEALGYDHVGYSIVRGSLPLKSLDLMVKDVRFEPSGWFLSETPLGRLPTPLRDRNPLRWTEVLPITEFVPPFVPRPVLPAQLKYTADLRDLLGDAAKREQPLRVEVLFQTRLDDLESLRALIQGRYPGASLDGAVGNVASIRLPKASLAESVAAEPVVIGVRLPRQAAETIAPSATDSTLVPQALRDARLEELQKLGYTGSGVKVVLVASDFTGAAELIGKGLPKRTTIVDLTTELSTDLQPAKPDPTRLKTGTAAAKALAGVAPDAELVLVRIGPDCFFHLYAVARLVRGDIQFTDALRVRLAELTLRSTALAAEKKAAIDAYRAAFSDLSDNEVAVKLRDSAKKELDAVIAREKELTVLVTRFNAFQKEIASLAGAHLIVNTLAWESGYPLDALNDFAGSLDRFVAQPGQGTVKVAVAKRPPLVWVQAGSAAGAAVWGGPFVDANRDGLLEFVPFGAKLPPEHWTPQLNFLGTQTASGPVSPDVAKGAKLRFVVQWREPADPNFPGSEVPLYPLTLRLLRQLDPAGEKRASDEMEEVARSVSVPNVLYRTRTYLVYEQMLEYEAKDGGRFALALESAAGPPPLLPGLRREIDIQPRVVVETLGVSVADPRAVFRSFTNFTAGVGTPGDALGAITVGVASPTSQVGAGGGVQLRVKPDLFGPEALALGAESYRGEGIAAAFVGGGAALLLQTGASGQTLFTGTGLEPGSKLELPVAWLRNVRRIERPKP